MMSHGVTGLERAKCTSMLVRFWEESTTTDPDELSQEPVISRQEKVKLQILEHL
jgi:hypothetical protein